LPLAVNGKPFDGEISFRPFEPVVYETVRTYCGKPFMLEEHLRRLRNSARIVGIEEIPPADLVLKTMDIASRGIEGEVYYKVYLRPSRDLIVEAAPAPEDLVIADLEFSPFRRSKVIPPQLKVIGRTDVLLARIHKRTYDVLMLSEDGYLAEGSFSNVFLVKGERIITPSLETGILSGITREVVLRIVRESGFEVEERFVFPWEVFESDEIFLTHTSRGIVPVSRVEWKEFEAPGDVTKKLRELFERSVMAEC